MFIGDEVIGHAIYWPITGDVDILDRYDLTRFNINTKEVMVFPGFSGDHFAPYGLMQSFGALNEKDREFYIIAPYAYSGGSVTVYKPGNLSDPPT